MPAGRPTDFSEDILKKSIEYIDSCEDKDINVLSGESESFKKYDRRINVKLPSIEGLSRHLKISRSTLYLWQKAHPEFSDIIEDLQQKQIERLINNGLSGDYNSTIAKVMLGKHGYTDKHEIDQKTELSGSIGFTGIEIVQPNAPNEKV